MQIGISDLSIRARGLMFSGILLRLFFGGGFAVTSSIHAAHFTEWRTVQEARLVQRVTTQGLKICTIVEEDQCWATPLPCSPYFDANLMMEFSGNGLPKLFWFPT